MADPETLVADGPGRPVVGAGPTGGPASAAEPHVDSARGGGTLSLLASDGLAYLMHWLVILVLLVQAVVSVVSPPGGDRAVGLVAGLVCLLWSSFGLGMGLLRGTGPDGGDLAPPGWLPVITSAGCLISLGLLRIDDGVWSRPWSIEFGTAALVVAATTVWRGEWAGGAVAVLLGAVAIVGPAVGTDERADVATPLQQSVAGIALIAAGFAVALALRWVRRSAQRLQESLEARDELLVRERAVRTASEVAAEAERSLHDTALNTLETIAAHGDHLEPELIRRRCRSDVEQLARWRSETGVRGLAEVLDRLAAHAERLGLILEIEQLGPRPGSEHAVQVPPPVLQAFAGAATEALTNVAKHAGVDRASVLVVTGPASLQLLIGDLGVGMAAAGGGFGVVASVTERMQAAGGTALVGPGRDGRGTVVALSWQPEPVAIGAVAGDLLERIAGVVVGVGTLLAGVATALVVLGWSTFVHPGAALIAPVTPVLIAAWLLNRVRAGGDVGSGQVLLACLAYPALGALAAFADPACSVDPSQGLLLDLRAPLAVVVLLLAPRPGVLLALLGTIVVANGGAAVLGSGEGGACGPQAAASGLYLVAGLLATWLFIRWLERAASEYAHARAEAMDAESRILARIAVRAEEELWVADALSSAQALLGAIAGGAVDPAARGTMTQCAAEAAYLRGLLAVGRAPQRVRRSARIWMRLLHAAGCQVRVRGSFVSCSPPARVVGQVGGALDTISALAPGSRVTLAAWTDPDTGSLTVTAQGAAVAAGSDGLAARIARVVGPAAWWELADDVVTVEWTWPDGEIAGAGDRAG